MKKPNKLENIILVLSFVVVLLFPYITALYNHFNQNDNKEKLSGSEEKVEFSFKNLDDYVIQNFPNREQIIKTKNQLLYSLFDISPNANITKIGDNLFSTETLNYYLHNLYDVEDKDVDELVEKFQIFNNFCKEHNKKMAIILTPCKPRYYSGEFPLVDNLITIYDKDYDKKDLISDADGNVTVDNVKLQKKIRPYNVLKNKLKETDIKFFDSIEYIDNNKGLILDGVPPLFYNSGHHWSLYKGNKIGLAFHQYLRENLGIKAPKLSIKASPSDTAIYPDSDLFDVLNIYDKPDEKFYESVVTFENFDTSNLNYLVQGGSFLGSLLIPQMTVNPFGDIVHIENKSMFYDKYRELVTFDSYEEADAKYSLLKRCKDTDVFVFEIHELNVYNATFGFLDFLIEHMGEI
ncbi:MAG: hypothetical protein J6M39_03910 [Lachnospiraceae bacterium]|nr:hypothetical protein [Lachnospiraceae bacterium]